MRFFPQLVASTDDFFTVACILSIILGIVAGYYFKYFPVIDSSRSRSPDAYLMLIHGQFTRASIDDKSAGFVSPRYKPVVGCFPNGNAHFAAAETNRENQQARRRMRRDKGDGRRSAARTNAEGKRSIDLAKLENRARLALDFHGSLVALLDRALPTIREAARSLARLPLPLGGTVRRGE